MSQNVFSIAIAALIGFAVVIFGIWLTTRVVKRVSHWMAERSGDQAGHGKHGENENGSS